MTTDYPLLSQIKSPADLKKLDLKQLPELARELRHRMIDVISVNGGHLASNLGSVEFSIAMHWVFESPSDKFIFDTSHQSYNHKLLTGRFDRFPTIRQHKGLCGFTHPDESEHDHFHAGHAGTALSLALGTAHNRDLSGRDEYVIPVLGDASLTCGLTLEALNNIPRDLKKFIVLLNDNAMSISPPVGSITGILGKLLNNPTANRFYQEMDAMVSKIPGLGERLSRSGKKVTGSLKNLVSPATFFEHFGLSYIGPVDGHNVFDMIRVLEGVKNSNWPVIIHTITHKGKGMEVAEQDPTVWHGAKPFDPDTCKFRPTAQTKPTFPKVFGKQMVKMAESDPSVVAVTPAMSAGSCLDPMMERFPERCFDVGIAEGHAVTFAGGLALGKRMKVVMSVYGTFLHRALDNLFHDVCIQELPVVFCIDRGGISGPDGRTHHGIYDISFLKAMPNMIITQPRNGQVLKELMESAFNWGHPVAIRYPNLPTEEPEDEVRKREVGKGEVLAKGSGTLIIALGHMCDTALEVRRQLMDQEMETATVLDPVFVKPLDSDLLCELLLTHDKVVTLEEHSITGGLGSAVNHFLMSQGFTNTTVLNLGIPETYVDQGKNPDLLKELGLTPEGITKSMTNHFSFAREKEPVG